VVASGSTASAPASRPSQASQGPDRATLLVTSGARQSNGIILEQYTCHGAGTSPEISWKGPPELLANAKEFLIMVRTIANGHLTTSWAVGGIGPSVRKIAAGQLPPGAVVGRNSFGKIGYEVCPPRTRSALIAMGVYALAHTIPLKPGFDPESLKPELENPENHWGTSIMFRNELSRPR
jgi:phosphatidylethanolamine-binding protein (PEBP) family uncharacterized protein